MIGRGQPSGPGGQNARLRRLVEGSRAPPFADQGARLIASPPLFKGGGVGDGAIDRAGRFLREQGQGGVRADAGSGQHLFCRFAA